MVLRPCLPSLFLLFGVAGEGDELRSLTVATTKTSRVSDEQFHADIARGDVSNKKRVIPVARP